MTRCLPSMQKWRRISSPNALKTSWGELRGCSSHTRCVSVAQSQGDVLIGNECPVYWDMGAVLFKESIRFCVSRCGMCPFWQPPTFLRSMCKRAGLNIKLSAHEPFGLSCAYTVLFQGFESDRSDLETPATHMTTHRVLAILRYERCFKLGLQPD